MQKREFLEFAMPQILPGITRSTSGEVYAQACLRIALEMWAEIEKECPAQREFALQDWKVPT